MKQNMQAIFCENVVYKDIQFNVERIEEGLQSFWRVLTS